MENDIIQCETIAEAKVRRPVTRNDNKIFEQITIPTANLVSNDPILAEKISSLRIRFYRNGYKNMKFNFEEIIITILIGLYLYMYSKCS